MLSPYDDTGVSSVPDMMPSLTLFTETFGDAAVETAISSELMARVGAGTMGPSARIHRTEASVAFGRADRNAERYPEAVAAARHHGFDAIERLAGGRAAVFHEETIAFSLVLPAEDARTGIVERFEWITSITVGALDAVGVPARVGEVPGEYCPGAYSVNARGRAKLAGFGQRIVKGAAHVGGVVVVDGAHRIRDVLRPVYAALGIPWDPATVGSVTDEGGPGVGAVAEALEASLADRWAITRAPLPEDLVAAGRRSAPTYRAAEDGAGRAGAPDVDRSGTRAHQPDYRRP
jgi:octanoyl-[GcvH]:protein N-octanoyltransferase